MRELVSRLGPEGQSGWGNLTDFGEFDWNLTGFRGDLAGFSGGILTDLAGF